MSLAIGINTKFEVSINFPNGGFASRAEAFLTALGYAKKMRVTSEGQRVIIFVPVDSLTEGAMIEQGVQKAAWNA